MLALSVHNTLNKINSARKEMERDIGRAPSVPELAHHLEMSVEKLQMYTDTSRNVVSLELPVGNTNPMKEDSRGH